MSETPGMIHCEEKYLFICGHVKQGNKLLVSKYNSGTGVDKYSILKEKR